MFSFGAIKENQSGPRLMATSDSQQKEMKILCGGIYPNSGSQYSQTLRSSKLKFTIGYQQSQEEATMIVGQEEEYIFRYPPHIPRTSKIKSVKYRIAMQIIFKGKKVRKTKINKTIRYGHHGDMKELYGTYRNIAIKSFTLCAHTVGDCVW